MICLPLRDGTVRPGGRIGLHRIVQLHFALLRHVGENVVAVNVLVIEPISNTLLADKGCAPGPGSP